MKCRPENVNKNLNFSSDIDERLCGDNSQFLGAQYFVHMLLKLVKPLRHEILCL